MIAPGFSKVNGSAYCATYPVITFYGGYKMSVIERALERLKEEERQNRLGADNDDTLRYWAAYLDGARAQKKELTTYPSRKEAEA